METSTAKKRSLYIDILRIIACLMVIYNHTNERGFFRPMADDLGSASFFLDVTMSTLCKAGVPIFFMISGSLLLRKDESIKKTFSRMIRIVLDLLVFSIAYIWIDSYLLHTEFSLKSAFSLILGSNYWHLWYLYSYIILILTLPILRKFVVGLDEKTSKYLFIIAVLFMGFMPFLSAIAPSGINENLKLTWMTTNVFLYPVLGYSIDKVIPEDFFTKKRILILWACNLISLILSELMEFWLLYTTADAPVIEGYFDERFLVNFCIVNAVTLYVTAKYMCSHINFNDAVFKVFEEIGRDTFGIYLLHIWFLWKIPFFFGIWTKFEHAGVLGYHFGILLSCLMVFVIAGVVTTVLRRIPIVNKLF